MGSILACVNLKGGVGKTTIAVNLAAYAGREGVKTLLVDMDPQTNATFAWLTYPEWNEYAENDKTLASLLIVQSGGDPPSAKDVIVQDVSRGVDLIPSHLDLFALDLAIAGRAARESLLRNALQPIADDYDLIVCDCPPNLTVATQNALAFSTHYLVPVSPDYLSALGIGLLLDRVERFAKDLQHRIELVGILICRVGRKAAIRDKIMAAIRQKFEALVLDTQLKERAVVSEAQEVHRSVFEMGNSRASREFRDACSEILRRMGF